MRDVVWGFGINVMQSIYLSHVSCFTRKWLATRDKMHAATYLTSIPFIEEAVTTEEAEEVNEMSFKSETLMRDTAAAVHRATTNLSPAVRAAALQSAEAMARECPLLVLQTWLDQFARVNGGTSPQDYVAANRVNLLNSLSAIVDCVVDQLDDTHPGQKSAIERIVSLATEEMTRHGDIIPTIQVGLGRHEMSMSKIATYN